MKNLYILCGAPGSRKSTWVREHLPQFNGYTVVASRDDIRFRLVTEDEPYFSKEKQVFREYIDLICDGLQHADNVIADATHLNVPSRRKLFNAISGQYNPKEWNVVALVMDTCLAECLKNNEQRKGTRSYVPESAIRNMFNSFKMPNLADEEYLDKVCIYRYNDEVKYIIKERG